MQAVIRLAVCLVMAGTAAAVRADGSAEAMSEVQSQQQVTTTTDAKAATDGDDVGHGSGEPGRSAAQMQADGREAKEAADSEQAFLNQVWAAP
jgi:hypothetical protein